MTHLTIPTGFVNFASSFAKLFDTLLPTLSDHSSDELNHIITVS